jgi:glutamate carboxypeptidase
MTDSRLPRTAHDEAQRVRAAADVELELLLDDLQAWVDTDSPGGDVSAVDRLAAAIGHRLDGFGLHVELVPAGDSGLYLHATLEGAGDARVVLLGHHDTVFPSGTTAARPFTRDGARCFGPGVADMKGGLVVAAHTARLLADGPRPFGRLELVSCPDEESRPTAPALLDRLRGADAVLCLECGRPDGEVVSARKAAWWFALQATGHPAHAGVEPDTGRNAVHAIAAEAMRLVGLHHARPGLTLQVTGLEGGEGLNTVPGAARLTGDMRAITAADLAWGRAQVLALGAHTGVDLALDDLGGPPALERTPAVATLAAAAIELGGALGHVFGEALTGGVSDASWTADAGIPTLDGLGPVGGLDHGPDEYVETPTLATRCGVTAGLVAAVDAGVLRDVG